MPAKFPLKLNLTGDAKMLNETLAEAEGLSPARHAALVLEEALRLKQRRISAGRQPAEGRLLNVVRKICSDLKEAGWPSDVTLRVFQHIEQEHRPLYDDALLSTERSRLNRAIGALVKSCLGTEPRRRTNDTVAMAFPKPGESTLIKSYTLLKSSEELSHDR